MKETSFKERFSYYSFFVGQNMANGIIALYSILYFTDYLEIPAHIIATIMLVTRIWDAVNDPMFGAIVDKVKFKKGKFKPWLNIAGIILPVTTILVFSVPNIGLVGKIVIVCVTYLLWDIAYTITDIPSFSISTAITANMNERNSILSLGRLFAVIGALIIAVLIMPLINSWGWTVAAIIIGVATFVLMNIQRFFIKERHIVNSDVSLKKIIKCLGSNKYLLIYYSAITVWSATFTITAMSSYFAIYNLGDDGMVSVLMMAVALPVFISALLVPILSKKWGKNKVTILACVVGIVTYVVYFFIGYTNLALVLIMTVLSGICFGFIQVMYPMYTSDCIEYGEWKTGERTTGLAFSMQTFTTKLGAALAVSLGGFLLSAFGYVPNAVQSERALLGIFSMMTLVPAAGLVIFLIIFGLFYKLKEADVERYIQENAQREIKVVD